MVADTQLLRSRHLSVDEYLIHTPGEAEVVVEGCGATVFNQLAHAY
jgi:hypothetical protein